LPRVVIAVFAWIGSRARRGGCRSDRQAD